MTPSIDKKPTINEKITYEGLSKQKSTMSAFELAQWIINAKQINESTKSAVIDERLKTLKKDTTGFMSVVKKIVSYVVTFFTFGTIVLFNDVIEKNRELELFIQRVQKNGSYEKPNVFNEKLDKTKSSMVAIPYYSNNCFTNGFIQITFAQKEFLKFLYEKAYEWLTNESKLEEKGIEQLEDYKNLLKQFLILFSSLVQENSNDKMLKKNGQDFREMFGRYEGLEHFSSDQNCAVELAQKVYQIILHPLDGLVCHQGDSEYSPTKLKRYYWRTYVTKEEGKSVRHFYNYTKSTATIIFEGQTGMLVLNSNPENASCVQEVIEQKRESVFADENECLFSVSKLNTGDTLFIGMQKGEEHKSFLDNTVTMFSETYFSFDKDTPGTKIIRVPQYNDEYKYYRLSGLSIYRGNGDYGHYTYMELKDNSIHFFDNSSSTTSKTITHEQAKEELNTAFGLALVYQHINFESKDSRFFEVFESEQIEKIQKEVNEESGVFLEKIEGAREDAKKNLL